MLANIDRRSILDYGILFGFWLIGCLTTLWAGTDVLDTNWLARSYVNVIETIFPMIHNYGKKSSFPQIAILYHAILFPAMPFVCRQTWIYLKTRKTGLLIKPRKELRFREYLILIFTIPFFSILGYAAFFLYTGEDARLFSFGSSRYSLAFWGFIVIWGGCFFITTSFLSIKKIITGNI